LLIEKWDEIHNTFDELDPVQILHSLMKEHDLKPEDLVPVLNTGKGYISDILDYKKGLSEEVTRKLANHFKISRQALNRPYRLTVPENAHEEKRGQ
jgi:HTH-type transcriptional regulator/antitoxin HigA